MIRTTWMTVLAAATGALAVAGCAALDNHEEQAIAHYVAGRLALEKQDYRLALDELAKAVQADPRLSSAYTGMGDIYRKQNNYEQAAIAYDSACQANPYDFKPHYNLGVAYQMLAAAAKDSISSTEFIAKAARVYIRAVTLRPTDFDANLNLSACYFQQGKSDLAVQYCKAAIELDSKNPFAYSNLGVIYDAKGLLYEAIGAYKQSLELDTHQAKLLVNLGSTYMKLRRLNEAVHAFELAAKEDPKWATPYEQIGACHFHQRDWDKSAEAYNRALMINPRSAPTYRGLGVMSVTRFLTEGKPELREQGLAQWQRSLELDPNQPDLKKLVEKYTPPPTTLPAL